MSSLNKQPPLLQEVVDQMRDNILRSQSTASTAAITSFDNLIEQLKVFVSQINAQSAEIKRLQGLCTKNKIDYSILPPKPISTHPSTQDITNPPKTRK